MNYGHAPAAKRRLLALRGVPVRELGHDGYTDDSNIFWKVPKIKRFPYDGSAIVIWDSGPGLNTPPPLTNTAPAVPANGEDPHSEPRSTVAAPRKQKSEFLKPDGAVVDECGGQPCRTDDFIP